MARNPYEVLGVARDAGEDDIRRAYRRLAKQYHPDLNPGNKEAEARFKEISAANDLLSDAAKRARYDRGEIDESGAEKPQYHANYRGFAEGPDGAKYYTTEGMAPEDLEELFAIFGRGAAGGAAGSGGPFTRRTHVRMRGADQHYMLTIDFLEAINGAKKRLQLAPDKSLDVTIPPGLHDGQILRLKEQGGEGIGGGARGDALIEVHVTPHPLFRREGDDIHVELPVTIAEATLGGRIAVPTPSGTVTMTVPAGSNTGTRLRLRGKGAPTAGGAHGDEYVTLKVVLPEGGDQALADFLRDWAPKHPYDPRRGMEPA
ncbi:MAG: J domain-containing protein [Alphaproteobacteria bacterium]|nr:J domain-containing protein [Alphaproteobacteria bacterium]